MKAWLETNGLPKTAKRKQDLVDRIKDSGLPAVIWDELVVEYEAKHEGKAFLSAEEYAEIEQLASVLKADDTASALLTKGIAEVSFFVTDPETGVLLKARMDYVKPGLTVDLKTFSVSRSKPIAKVINDAIYYEGYYQQAVFYQKVRELARQQLASGEIQTHGEVPKAWLKAFLETEATGFLLLFIESEAPFHLDKVLLHPSAVPGADQNVYWTDAELRIEEMTRRYTECRAKWGESEWREAVPYRTLEDTDIPQLMFSGGL